MDDVAGQVQAAVAAERKAASGPVEVAAPKPAAAAPGAEFPPMRGIPADRAAMASARASLVRRVRKLGIDDPHAALRALPEEAFYQLEDAQRADTLADKALAAALGVKAPRARAERKAPVASHNVTRRNVKPRASSRAKGKPKAEKVDPRTAALREAYDSDRMMRRNRYLSSTLRAG